LKTRSASHGSGISRLRKKDPEITSQITDVPEIIGFRNKLIHEYPDIEDAQVWKMIQDDIPRLLAEVRALLPPAP